MVEGRHRHTLAALDMKDLVKMRRITRSFMSEAAGSGWWRHLYSPSPYPVSPEEPRIGIDVRVTGRAIGQAKYIQKDLFFMLHNNLHICRAVTVSSSTDHHSAQNKLQRKRRMRRKIDGDDNGAEYNRESTCEILEDHVGVFGYKCN